jgi:Ca2+-binding EF-hand superfamily protein
VSKVSLHDSAGLRNMATVASFRNHAPHSSTALVASIHRLGAIFMMLLRSPFLMATVILATPAAAQTRLAAPPAQAPGPRPIPRATFLQNMDSDFSKMDANHDGKVTKLEIEAFQTANARLQIEARNRQIFAALDTDHNGQLSPAEFARFTAQPPPPNSAPMLRQFDTNRDGAITQLEFRTGTLANFDRLDADKDGVVSAAEMRAGGIVKK